METIESQTQQERLYEGLPNRAEIQMQMEAMVVSLAATQSILPGGEADDDLTPTGHIANVHRVGETLSEMDAEFLNGRSVPMGSGVGSRMELGI